MEDERRTQTHAAEGFNATRTLLALWAGVLAAPLAFLLNLQIAYTLVTLACDAAAPWLHLTSVAMLALASAGGYVAWREWRRAGAAASAESHGPVPRSRFLATLGLMTSALFSLVILWQWIPVFILPPCGQI